MAKLSPVFNDQTFTDDGDPAVGYKLFTYTAGSSSKQTTYSDAAGTIPNSNPIIINSLGYPTQGPIWLTEGTSTKFVLALPTDTDPPTSPIKTIDNVSGVGDNTVSVSQWVSSGVVPTYVSASSFTVLGDQTSEFQVGRRLQFTVSAGTVYGNITASAFTTLTTVTMQMDAGTVLDAGLSIVNLSLLKANPLAVPSVFNQSIAWSGTSVIQAKGVTVPSAATTTIFGATDGNTVDISGNTGPITSLGTAQQAGYNLNGTFLSNPVITPSANLTVNAGQSQIQIFAGDSYIATAQSITQHSLLIFRKNGAAPLGPAFLNYRDVTTTGTVFTQLDIGTLIGINIATSNSHTFPTVTAADFGKTITINNYGAGIATFNRATTSVFLGANLNSATSFPMNQGEVSTWSVAATGNWVLASSNVNFFGPPQTWQDFTGSRVIGTTYQNLTGRPIQVVVVGNMSAGGGSATFLVAGSSVAAFGGGATANAAQQSCYVIVPNGATYSVAAASFVLQSWKELR